MAGGLALLDEELRVCFVTSGANGNTLPKFVTAAMLDTPEVDAMGDLLTRPRSPEGQNADLRSVTLRMWAGKTSNSQLAGLSVSPGGRGIAESGRDGA